MEVSCYKRRKFADRDDIYPQAGTVCGYLSIFKAVNTLSTYSNFQK